VFRVVEIRAGLGQSSVGIERCDSTTTRLGLRAFVPHQQNDMLLELLDQHS
jgi:hypothetical protein